MCSFCWVLKINFLFSNNSFSCLCFLFFLCFKFLILRNITFLSQRTENTLYFSLWTLFYFYFVWREFMYWLSVLLSFLSCGVLECGLPASPGLSVPLSVNWAVVSALQLKTSSTQPGLAAWMPSPGASMQLGSWGCIHVLLPLWVQAFHEL